jgi:hypothetical protein
MDQLVVSLGPQSSPARDQQLRYGGAMVRGSG